VLCLFMDRAVSEYLAHRNNIEFHLGQRICPYRNSREQLSLDELICMPKEGYLHNFCSSCEVKYGSSRSVSLYLYEVEDYLQDEEYVLPLQE
jgi:hypothetical protein